MLHLKNLSFKNISAWLIGTIICFLLPSYGSAEVYKWVDSEGVVHFGDRAPAKKNSEIVDIKEMNVIHTIKAQQQDTQSTKPPVKKDIVMYSTSWCPFCTKARKYFTEKGIDYTEYDVEKLPGRMREFKKYGGTGYPLILIGKTKMQGFSIPGFEKLYNR